MRVQLVVFLLCICPFGFSQDTLTPQRLLQRMLAVSGWNASGTPNDAYAAGQVRAVDTLNGATFVLSERRNAMRYEVKENGETAITVINGDQASRTRDSATKELSVSFALSGRTPTFPFFASFVEGQGNSVKFVSTEQVEADIADVIEISPNVLDTDRNASFRRKAEHYKLWISRQTGFLVQIEFVRLGSNNPYAESKYLRQLSDYRKVDGVFFPFRQIQFLDGKPELVFEFTDVRFNTGLSDASFMVPTGR